MKTTKIIYWSTTGLFCLWMTFQGVMFTISSEQFSELFTSLGMPVTLIMPLGIAKLLAVVVILYNKSPFLKYLAYVGLGVDFVVALVAHLNAGDGSWPAAAIALLLGSASFIYWMKLQ